MPPPTLLLATRNPGKVREMSAILAEAIPGLKIVGASEFPATREPEETEPDFAGNARLKALHYSISTGLPALADDSGLEVDGLGGRPGVASARYAPTDAERIAKLLAELEEAGAGVHRYARFRCAMALSMPTAWGRPMKVLAPSQGTLEGAIATSPRGAGGFGYDPIFAVEEAGGRHLAELAPEEKNRISHRFRALQAIVPRLRALLTP